MIQQGRAFAYFGGTYSEALDAVGEVVAGLSTNNFAYSQSLTWDVADVTCTGSFFEAVVGT